MLSEVRQHVEGLSIDVKAMRSPSHDMSIRDMGIDQTSETNTEKSPYLVALLIHYHDSNVIGGTADRRKDCLTGKQPIYIEPTLIRSPLSVMKLINFKEPYHRNWKLKTQNRNEWKRLGESYFLQWNIIFSFSFHLNFVYTIMTHHKVEGDDDHLSLYIMLKCPNKDYEDLYQNMLLRE